jgi:hypothetical protein
LEDETREAIDEFSLVACLRDDSPLCQVMALIGQKIFLVSRPLKIDLSNRNFTLPINNIAKR